MLLKVRSLRLSCGERVLIPWRMGREAPIRSFRAGQRKRSAPRTAHRDRLLIEMAPRTCLSKAMEGNGVTVDLLSLGRNSTSGIATIAGSAGKVAGAVGGVAIAGGVMGVAGGLNAMRNAGIRLSKDYETGNWEGGAVNSLSLFSGAGYGTVSGSMVVANAATFAGAAGTAAAAGSAITVAGLAMYGLIGIAAGYGIGANLAFRSRIDRFGAEDGKQLAQTVLWLAGQVRAEDPSKLEKKWNRFAYRSSESACRFVREKATPELIARLEQNEPSAIAEAKEIIREVKRENAKQLIKHTVMKLIALVGIAAFVCGIIYATGPFAPLLFALGAILWLLVDSSKVHEALGNLVCGASKIPPPALAVEQPAPAIPQERPVSWPKAAGAAVGTLAAAYAAPTLVAAGAAAGAAYVAGNAAYEAAREARRQETILDAIRVTLRAGREAAERLTRAAKRFLS